MPCDHNYQFQGVVYSYGHQLVGSGARAVFYEDKYFCTNCLDIKFLNKREHGNSYQKAIEGTMPK
jgi:hypothetical protein